MSINITVRFMRYIICISIVNSIRILNIVKKKINRIIKVYIVFLYIVIIDYDSSGMNIGILVDFNKTAKIVIEV